MTGRERRKEPRLDEGVRVAYRTIREGDSTAKTVATKTLNLSASGLCLLASEPIDPEHHLALELTLEGHPDKVVAMGRVVWCDRAEEAYRVGVCFTWVREEDRGSLKVIADYVQARGGS